MSLSATRMLVVEGPPDSGFAEAVRRLVERAVTALSAPQAFSIDVMSRGDEIPDLALRLSRGDYGVVALSCRSIADGDDAGLALLRALRRIGPSAVTLFLFVDPVFWPWGRTAIAAAGARCVDFEPTAADPHNDDDAGEDAVAADAARLADILRLTERADVAAEAPAFRRRFPDAQGPALAESLVALRSTSAALVVRRPGETPSTLEPPVAQSPGTQAPWSRRDDDGPSSVRAPDAASMPRRRAASISPARAPRSGGALLPALAGAALAGAALAFLFRRELAPLFAPLLSLFGASAPTPGAVGAGGEREAEFAAFAPMACRPGDTMLVQALVYLPTMVEAARAAALEADPETRSRGARTLALPLAPGDAVDIDIEAPGCDVDEPRQSATWSGRPLAVQFFVATPAAGRAQAPIRLSVARQGVPMGSVRFVVAMAGASAGEPPRLVGDAATRHRRAFLSYASADREKAIETTRILSLAGIEVFQDVVSLEPGERWEPRLFEEIGRCDLFLLLWSTEASRSEWVRREAEYALALNERSGGGPPEIKPVVLEGPPLPAIPPSLGAIHFNDKFRYFALAAGIEAGARRAPPA